MRLFVGRLQARRADVRVDLRRHEALVSEEFLDHPNVVPVFKKMGREGMAKCVATGCFGDPGCP